MVQDTFNPKAKSFFRWTCLTLWFSMLEPRGSPYNWVGFHPLWTLNKQGSFFQRHLWRSNKPRMLGPRGGHPMWWIPFNGGGNKHANDGICEVYENHGFMDVSTKIHNYCWWTKTSELVNIINISVDNSLIYHQIAVFHPKMVEEFAHQPNDLISETRWNTIASDMATQSLANKDRG